MTEGGVPDRTPSPRANRWMTRMLKTPGLQRLVGRHVALLAVQGSKSGKRYEFPISYSRHDGEVTMLTRRTRRWWRNLVDHPQVELRLAGKALTGRAELIDGAVGVETVREFLRGRRMDARAYGIALGPDGLPSEADVSALLPALVVIRVTVD